MDALETVRIGHVLFLDLVGYSAGSVENQVRTVGALMRTIRSCPVFDPALQDGRLLSVPSGDGVALVFFDDPRLPSTMAAQIAERLDDLSVRMGIHTGPVGLVDDIRGGMSAVGEGINGAKRVMDCAGPGEVLVSAEWVEKRRNGCAGLRDRGTVVAKHGRLLRVWEFPLGGNARHERRVMVPFADSAALPVDSPRYVEREADSRVRRSLMRHDSIVLINGGRQTGKSSLIARALGQVRSQGTYTAVFDLRGFADSDFDDVGVFLRRIAEGVCDDARVQTPVDASWDNRRTAGANLQRWLLRHVLPGSPDGLVIAIDQADRLLRHAWCGEVFGLFRSWHNRRAMDPDPAWTRLSIAIGYTAEAHRFIADPHQSPFNVGTPVVLQDLTLPECEVLRLRLMPGLNQEPWESYCHWVGGHPYLVQLGLDAMGQADITLSELQDRTRAGDGPLGFHMQALDRWLDSDPRHRDWLRLLLDRRTVDEPEAMAALRGFGLVGVQPAPTGMLRSPLLVEWASERC